MKNVFVVMLCVLGLAAGSGVTIGTYKYASAQGYEAPHDAGALEPDAGLTVSRPVATIAPAEPKQVHDPVTDPGGYAQDVLGAFRAAQYAFFVVLTLFGISRLAIYLDDKFDIPWLERGRSYIVFGSSVLGGAIVSLAALSTVDLRVVVGSVASAAILELRGRGKMTLEARAKSMYEAYLDATGGVSAVSGAPLPSWETLALPGTPHGADVRRAWLAAAKVA